MRKIFLVVSTLGVSVFVATNAEAGSVSNAIKGIGAATQTAAKGAASSAKTAPPTSHTRPVQSMKTPHQLGGVDGETKGDRHAGE